MKRKPKSKRETLTKREKAMLQRLRKKGYRLVSPTFNSITMSSLVEKNYVRELPGLIDGMPQGFVPI